MLNSIICVCPPALHPRTAAMLGDSVNLHFFSDSTIASEFGLKIPAESVDRCYIELPDSLDVHPSFLPEVMRVLKKGAKICVRHRSSMKWTDLFIFSGFVDAVQREGDGVTFETTCAKPHWDAGAAMPLSLKKQNNPAPVKPAATKVWTISADDGDELMDEDALLAPADLQPKPRPAATAPSDCEVSEGRKACKNCTCGRAEAESADANNGAPPSTANATSACGSCYLGDAFRCASCPYKGLPPFKPGEQVIISAD